MFRRSFIASALIAAACLSAPACAGSDPLNIVVSILPQKAMAEEIGGAHVEVQLMVPPGAAPATFEPSPAQMAALHSADLYVAMGIPHEKNWLPQIRAARPDMPVLALNESVTMRSIMGHGQNVGREIPDPHIWLAPPQLRQIAAALRDSLSALDPSRSADFAVNTEAWLARLDAADRDVAERLAPFRGRAFLTFHPAWGYVADAYGLEQIAIEQQGMEPGPRMIAAAIDAAKAAGIRVIFVQQQFSSEEAETVAREIGGQVVRLDPLAADPVDNLAIVADAFAASFR